MKRPVERTLDTRIEKVMINGNCSGCGACVHLDGGLRMQFDTQGFLRPRRVRPTTAGRVDGPDPGAAFEAMCPGVRVRSPRPRGAVMHPTMGPAVQAWEAWSTDEELRYRGSSGGVLTALSAWLVTTGEVHLRNSVTRPRRPTASQRLGSAAAVAALDQAAS